MKKRSLAIGMIFLFTLCACSNNTKSTEAAIYRGNGSWMTAKDNVGGSCLSNIENSTSKSIELIGFVPGKFVSHLEIGKRSPEWMKASNAEKGQILDLLQSTLSAKRAEIKIDGNNVDVKTTMFDEQVLLRFKYDKEQDLLNLYDLDCDGKCLKNYIPNTAMAENIKKSGGIKYKFCPGIQ